MGARHPTVEKDFPADPGRAGFTLIELLVVMAIIAILASIGLPALRGMGRSAAIEGATRQMRDDLNLARLRAMSGRTTVYVVFVPTNLVQAFPWAPDERTRRQLTNLFSGQYSAYALMTRRTVGDQPGRQHPQYVTEWKRLPEGVVIAPYKFRRDPEQPWNSANPYTNRFLYAEGLPFPGTDTPTNLALPFIAFNSQGQLISGRDEVIPLARGSVMVNKDANGLPRSVDLEIKPKNNFTNNYIRVNWLTGRASAEGPVMR